MIFNEIYSAYYNAVAKIITAILNGMTEEKDLNRIVCDTAFGESMLTVLPSLKSQKWQLIRRDGTTPIRRRPTMPLTLIQKQWLKAISLDPRIRLFGTEFPGLEDVLPLFTPADYILYDKYGDGDPYEEEGYIQTFRTVLSALKEEQLLKLQTVNRRGYRISMTVRPLRLEYSEKDDKFRLISQGCHYGRTVNLGRILSCEACPAGNWVPKPAPPPVKRLVTLCIRDERNALERCMLHFSHFEKQAERLDSNRYLIRIRYEPEDETEMVIRILGFGPLVEVTEPPAFRNLMIERLKKQKSCGL